MPLLGGILGLVGFFALVDISIEMTKIRKILESQAALRRDVPQEADK